MHPDEGRVSSFARRWYQDVDELRGRSPDAMLAQGGQAGDHAAASRVQHRGHFLLNDRGSTGRGQVDAGNQAAPWTFEPETMTQGTGGDTNGQRLMTRDHVNLAAQDLVECIVASMCRSAHAGIMRPESDKTPLGKYHQIAANPAFPRELSSCDLQALRH
jgi:hypothetical protein